LTENTSAVGPANRQSVSSSEGSADAPLRSQAEPASQPVPAKVIRYAERLISQRDGNGDESLDRQEWGRVWGFLTSDANLDGRVSLKELVQQIGAYGRYRRVRLLPPISEGGGDFPTLLNPSTEAELATARPQTVADTNASGGEGASANSSTEPNPLRGKKFVPSEVRQPAGLPSWFAGRDADGDGQLSMAEFAPKPTGTSLAEFSRYDRDGNGVITPSEYVRAVKSAAEKSGR
jgi:hypothetical protein